MISSVEQGSKGLYHLKMKNLYFNLLTGRINITGIQLIPDTALYNSRQGIDTLSPMLLELHVDHLQIQGLDFQKFIKERALFIRKIVIGKPDVTLIIKQLSQKQEKKGIRPQNAGHPLTQRFGINSYSGSVVN